MELHIRVYNAANLEAMRCLSKTAYIVLMYLVCRADSLGRCFPSAERIAQDIGSHADVVYKTLQTLEDEKYIGYLRRNAQDEVTGRFLPNVYIVNPLFICLAEENQEQAENLWLKVYPNFVPTFRHFIGTNQQQEPAPENNASRPESKSSSSNQRFSESDEDEILRLDEKVSGGKSKKPKSEKAKNSSAQDTPEQQAEGQQRSKKHRRSAAYSDPDPVPAPLGDVLLEALAERVNGLGVPIVQARGFVVSYGAEKVERALLQVEAAKRKGRSFKNDAGFFRYVLQNNLIDSLPEVLKPQTWGDLAGD